MISRRGIFYHCNLLFLITVISAISFTPAKEIRITGSNRAEYWLFLESQPESVQADSNYREHFEDKLKLAAYYGDITLKGVLFQWDPSLFVGKKYGYIDYTALYTKDPVNVTYGRYYTTFGRGLCLNQFLDEDFRNDNSLFGARGDIKFYKSTLTALTGRPRNLFFEQNTYKVKNDTVTADQIRGANLETRLLPKTVLAGRYVRINRKNDLTPQAFTELFGGNIGVSYGPGDVYFEYARLLGCMPVFGGRIKGDAFYGSAGFAISGLGLTLQYMDYDSIDVGGIGYRYNEPPNPIKSGIGVNRGNDEKGFGISLVASPFEFLSGELHFNSLRTHSRTGESSDLWRFGTTGVDEQILKIITHPNLQTEFTVSVDRLVKDSIELPVESKTELKPYVDLSYDLGSFYLEGDYELDLVTADTSDYNDQAISFSIGKPELFAFTLRYERRNRVPEWLVEKISDETQWPLAQLSIDISNRHNLRIRVGAEKGGLVCMGGVCRWESPFKGIKVVLTSLF
ncbi:MAG TPA: DUF6029 family protein [bacterium]